MNYDELALLVCQITYKPGTQVVLRFDRERPYLQVECERIDIVTGQVGVGRGGKYTVASDATLSEVVAGIFGLYRAYEEHEAREWFKYRGRRVFGPHIDVEELWNIARHTDSRPGPTSVRATL